MTFLAADPSATERMRRAMPSPCDAAITCDGCEEELQKGKVGGRSSTQRYCSNACRQRAYRTRSVTNQVDLTTSGGFPSQLSSFVGCDDDIVEIERLLRAVQVLTLAGPPGAGKTRLAMELAKRRMRNGRTEVVHLKLDVDDSADRIRERLDHAFRAGTPATTHSAQASRDRLLILNDCDRHLEQCCQSLCEQLSQDPKLHVLVTSREQLRLPGELVYAVTGLSLPSTTAAGAIEYLRSDAVRLFAERARAINPDFCLTDRNAEAIGQICTQVDGLPLAIELAARLVRIFSLSELANRIEDRLGTLAEGWRTAEERHHSWRAALAWGYEHLETTEQALFQRMSVFPDGFGLDAVAAMYESSANESTILKALIGLESKSMVTVWRESDAAPARFRILDSVRCYGQDRLVETGEQEQVEARLVQWATLLALPMHTSAIPSTLELHRIGQERNNIKLALHLLAGSDDERQLSLVAALVQAEALHQESSPDTEEATRRALAQTDPSSAYRYLAVEAEATLAGRRQDDATELQLIRQAVELSRAAEDRPATSRLLLRLSRVRDIHGDRLGAETELTDCLMLSERLGDDRMVTLCRGEVAWHQLLRGEVAQAAQGIQRVLPVVRERVPLTFARDALHTAGAIALERNDPATAASLFLESLDYDSDHPHTTAYAVAGLGVVAIRQAHLERGVKLLAFAEKLDTLGLDARGWWCDTVRKASAVAAQTMSRSQFDAAVIAGRDVSPQEAGAQVLREWSELPSHTPLRAHPLTPREWQVVALLTKGLANRQIASRMHLSVRTVESHMRNIRVTLGLRSRAHIAAWVMENGLGLPRPDAGGYPRACGAAFSVAPVTGPPTAAAASR